MKKITLQVAGMSCPHCEQHVNDAIKQHFAVQTVVSSHKKNTTELIADSDLDAEQLKSVIAAEGYQMLSYHSEDYKKPSFSFLLK